MQTFGIGERNIKTAESVEKFELDEKDITGADSKASIVGDELADEVLEEELDELEDDALNEEFIEDEVIIEEGESDQVFTPINSPKYISIQPTSDPIATDPPPPLPPTIPEDADVYFLENGYYVYFEEGRHKLGAIVMNGSSTILIGVPDFGKTRKALAEEVATELGFPIYGIEDPNPNSEPSSDPGNSNSPDDPTRLDDFVYYYDDGAYIQKEVLYKIYKDNFEYYAIGPDYPNNLYDHYAGGSVSSNDDNSGIASVINRIEQYWAL